MISARGLAGGGVNPELWVTCRSQAAAVLVGELLAERAKAASIDSVSWQRKQGQRFHGKAAALLTAMQSAGLPLK